jgi:hypothetical protein
MLGRRAHDDNVCGKVTVYCSSVERIAALEATMTLAL